MKKVLFASTALVAFAVAGAAQAADPIALKVGGYSKWLIGFANVDNEPAGGIQDLDLYEDSEVFFSGATTLDNGLKIGWKGELEAGLAGGGTFDEMYITVDGGWGRLIIGNEDNGGYLLHVSAPDAAGMSEDNPIALKNTVLGSAAGVGGNTIPQNTGAGKTTALLSGADHAALTYVAPTFAGFTVGASWIPEMAGAQFDVFNAAGEGADGFGIAGAYNNTFGSVGVKLSAAYATILDDDGMAATFDDFDQFTLGAQFGFGGFTVGGAYKHSDTENTGGVADVEFDTWTAGVQYATGPYAVSLVYWHDDIDNGNETTDIHVSGKYNMGPGVDLIGSIGHVDVDVAGAADNDGWGFATGMALSF